MRDMSISGKAAASAVLLLVVTACSSVALDAPVRSTLESASGISTHAERLFVANFATSTVTIYRADQQDPSPIETLTNGIVAPRSLWIDAAGTLYVANDFGNNNPYSDTVTEFAPGSRAPDKVLTGLIFPGAVAVDSRGTVYVQDESAIEIFEHGSTTPTRTITGTGNGANALAVDDHDNVYALIPTARGQNENCYSYVVRIPRGASQGSRIGVSAKGCGYGLAFDARENLYLAYYGDNNVSKIDVFHKNAHTPFRRITRGLAAPFEMAFGPDGSLFVPNDNSNAVTVYPSGGNTPMNTITKGIANPFSLALSPAAPY
jgi:hypothetical protein